MSLKGFQKKYLRGLAHKLKPVVFIGQKGVTPSMLKSVDEALGTHELIKLKFVDFKEKELKIEIIATIESKTDSQAAGLIGHTAILFRQNNDPEKQKIRVPEKN